MFEKMHAVIDYFSVERDNEKAEIENACGDLSFSVGNTHFTSEEKRKVNLYIINTINQCLSKFISNEQFISKI